MATCLKCGCCVKVCPNPHKAIHMEAHGPAFSLEHCIACGHCVAACPTDAIEHPKSKRQELLQAFPPQEQAANYLRGVRSVRHFKGDVSRDRMEELLDIGRYAQTGSNSQGISYLVLDGREKVVDLLEFFCQTVDEIADSLAKAEGRWLAETVHSYRATGYDGVFRGCPQLILALCGEDNARGRANAQFSLTYIALYAPALGIGTCWAGIFERLACHPDYSRSFCEHIGVPDGKRICGAMMAGLPGERYRRHVQRDPLSITWK